MFQIITWGGRKWSSLMSSVKADVEEELGILMFGGGVPEGISAWKKRARNRIQKRSERMNS